MARWTLRLAQKADQDMAEIIAWTVEHFGSRQAVMYAETLTMALEALFDGTGIIGARRRDDIQPGVSLLHVARQGRRGRHVIVFRPGNGRVIDVLRILHDSMDIERHLDS
ncbi:MAG: type II toxin-antitoxin system RelE/ParE family toxin [Desulfovibrionales bacterium]|nr:MAG: type II toxin-antitoxin system RelE/ParE family toxin [Desulfovibrionales bacterium]